MSTNLNPQHQEGPVARAIEEQTAKLPSDLFLWAAFGSIAISLAYKIAGKDDKEENKASIAEHRQKIANDLRQGCALL